jgi:hypothetical protein
LILLGDNAPIDEVVTGSTLQKPYTGTGTGTGTADFGERRGR